MQCKFTEFILSVSNKRAFIYYTLFKNKKTKKIYLSHTFTYFHMKGKNKENFQKNITTNEKVFALNFFSLPFFELKITINWGKNGKVPFYINKNTRALYKIK